HPLENETLSNVVKLGMTVFLALLAAAAARAEEKKAYSGAGCAANVDEFFANEVWTKVASTSCLKCHKPGGDADDEDSKFILQDPARSVGGARDDALRHNRDMFAKMALQKDGDQSVLLLKAIGKLKHGGKEALKPDSAGYRIL